jgi:hypothetical protein
VPVCRYVLEFNRSHLLNGMLAGTNKEMQAGRCDQVWRMGSLYLIEGELSVPMIATSYILGPGYSGNFQHVPLTPYQTCEMISHNNLTLARILYCIGLIRFI